MDRFEELAVTAPNAIVIMGNPSQRDYELLDLSTCPPPPSVLENFHERGFQFVGLVGVVNGVPRTQLATPLDSETVDALAAAVLLRLGAEFSQRLANDPELVEHVERVAFDAFMRHLTSLPDTRD